MKVDLLTLMGRNRRERRRIAQAYGIEKISGTMKPYGRGSGKDTPAKT